MFFVLCGQLLMLVVVLFGCSSSRRFNYPGPRCPVKGRDGKDLIHCPTVACDGMGHVSGNYATHRRQAISSLSHSTSFLGAISPHSFHTGFQGTSLILFHRSGSRGMNRVVRDARSFCVPPEEKKNESVPCLNTHRMSRSDPSQGGQM